jgi:hypothetical protein
MPLALGNLSSTTSDLYVVQADRGVKLESILVTNTGASTRSVNIYIKDLAGTEKHISPQDVQVPADDMAVINWAMTIFAGDIVRGKQDTGTDCEYVLLGVGL